MDRTSLIVLVVGISEVVAVFLIWRIWRTTDYLFIKISLSILAIIPVIGTLAALWIHGFPPAQPEALRSRSRGDMFQRWRHVLDEEDDKKKRRSVKRLLQKGYDDEGPL